MSRVGRSASESPAARLTAVVVLPTPPFWLTTAMTLPTTFLRAPRRSVPRATLYTLLMLTSAGSFHVQHLPQRPLPGQHFLEVGPSLGVRELPGLGSVDSESTGRRRSEPRHDHPLALGQGVWRRRPGRYDHSPRGQQSRRQWHQLINIAGASHDNRVEAALKIRQPTLDAISDDVRPSPGELSNDGREKRGSPTT